MRIIIKRVVLLIQYVSGLVIAKYLSIDMTHKFNIEAVQDVTSDTT
jgi:hypothetical protein